MCDQRRERGGKVGMKEAPFCGERSQFSDARESGELEQRVEEKAWELPLREQPFFSRVQARTPK